MNNAPIDNNAPPMNNGPIDNNIPLAQEPTNMPSNNMPTNMPSNNMPTNMPSNNMPTNMPSNNMPSNMPSTGEQASDIQMGGADEDPDAKPVDAPPVASDAKPVDAPPVDAPPVDAKPVASDAKPVASDAKPVDMTNEIKPPAEELETITINPDLDETLLQSLVNTTRKLIVELYVACENDFLEGITLFESIVAVQLAKTTASQIKLLNDISLEYLDEHQV
jgi:hypothetical protein